MVSIPVAAGLAGTVKAAIDFESAFAGVEKTVDASRKQLVSMRREIRAMARETPASTTEIAAVAEAAGQLGIKVPAIMGFTRTMIDLGNTTNMAAGTAAEALARLANITQMPQKQFDRLGATVVDLGNKGAATEEEIVMMGMRIAGAGHQIGLSEAQILSFAESLSSVGIRVEAGGSAISRVFVEMATAVDKGGKDLRNYAEVADTTTTEFAKRFRDDAAGAVIDFLEGLGRIKEEGGSTFKVLEQLGFSEIRVRDALLRAAGAGDLFRRSQEVGNRAWRENNALTEEASKRYRTQASQLKVLWNQLKDIAITIGNDLMPVVKDIAVTVRDWLRWFRQLEPETRALFIKGALGAIVLGPILRILGGVAKVLAVILRTSKSIAAIRLWSGIGKGLPGGAAGGAGKAGAGAAAGGAGLASYWAAGGAALAAGAAPFAPALLPKTAPWDLDNKLKRENAAAGVGDPKNLRQLDALRERYELLNRQFDRLENHNFGEFDIPLIGDMLPRIGFKKASEEMQGEMQGLQDAIDKYPLFRDKQFDRIKTQIDLLQGVNAKLSQQEAIQLANILAAEDFGKAQKFLNQKLEEANERYLRKHKDEWGKMVDGWAAGLDKTTKLERKVLRLNEALGKLPSEVSTEIRLLSNNVVTDGWAAWAVPGKGGKSKGGGGGGGSGTSTAGGVQYRDRPMRYKARGPGLFRIGAIDEEIEMRPQGSTARGGGGVKVQVQNVNIDLGGRDDLTAAAREAADVFMDEIASRVEEQWGNTP